MSDQTQEEQIILKNITDLCINFKIPAFSIDCNGKIEDVERWSDERAKFLYYGLVEYVKEIMFNRMRIALLGTQQ
jgi:hypothetical protein